MKKFGGGIVSNNYRIEGSYLRPGLGRYGTISKEPALRELALLPEFVPELKPVLQWMAASERSGWRLRC
jgi:hypothetical protein